MGKIYKMTETSSIKNILSGIYKINFPNGKCYIGLSNNIHKRILQHNRMDFKLDRIVGRAINKYGSIAEFELLEFIQPENRQLMNEREKYWINFYQSNNREYGYNMTEGGDGGNTGSGVDNPFAAFNQQQLNEIINLLKNEPTLTMIKIAEKYNVHTETIRAINRGERYVQQNIKYPIRQSYNPERTRRGSRAKFSDDQVKEIIELLRSSSFTFTEIAEKYDVGRTSIGKINSGKTYYNSNLKYPIRDKETKKEYNIIGRRHKKWKNKFLLRNGLKQLL